MSVLSKMTHSVENGRQRDGELVPKNDDLHDSGGLVGLAFLNRVA